MTLLASSRAVIAQEPLTDGFWGEIMPLLEAHWQEVAHYQDMPLKPNRERYALIDRNGCLRIYTARVDGRLVGYVVYFVGPSMHYVPHIFANDDILFIDKAHRGTRTGVDLIRASHRLLKADGVTMVMHHTKARSELNIGKMLMRFLKAELVDEIYACRLDGG